MDISPRALRQMLKMIPDDINIIVSCFEDEIDLSIFKQDTLIYFYRFMSGTKLPLRDTLNNSVQRYAVPKG